MKAQNPAALAMWLVAVVLAIAPLVVLPAQIDFALLPQQAFIQAIALALALWVLTNRELRERIARMHLGALDLPLAAFVGWSAVSLAATPDRQDGLRILLQWLTCGVFYVVVSRLARRQDLRRLASGALVGAALATCVGFGQVVFALAVVPQAVGPAATMANRDLAAAHLVTVLPLALLALGRRRWLVAAAAAAIVGFLPFTKARGAALAIGLQLVIVVGVVVVRVSAERARLRVAAIAAALAIATFGATASLFVTAVDPAKERSLGIRRDLATTALAMGLEHPLLGVGLGRFGAEYPAHGPAVHGPLGVLRVEHAHNEPLQVLAESGLPALLSLAWIVVSAAVALARLLRSRRSHVRRAALVLGLSSIALVVDAAFGFPLRVALSPLLAAVVLGLITRLDRVAVPATMPVRCARPPLERWLIWTVGPTVAAVLVGATALSILRLAADGALCEMAFAESEARWQDAVLGRAEGGSPRSAPRSSCWRWPVRNCASGSARRRSRLLRRVLAARPSDSTAVATLGSVRWAAGDHEGARASWRLARMLREGGFVPITPGGGQAVAAGTQCASGVTVSVGTDGFVTLSARGETLAEVLRCLSARTRLKVDYDGAPPRQRVTVDIPAAPLTATLASLFEGLGINYMVSGGSAPEAAYRLIVFGGAGGSARPAAAPGPSGSQAPQGPPPEPFDEEVPAAGESARLAVESPEEAQPPVDIAVPVYRAPDPRPVLPSEPQRSPSRLPRSPRPPRPSPARRSPLPGGRPSIPSQASSHPRSITGSPGCRGSRRSGVQLRSHPHPL